MKKYLKTAAVLASICAVSAILLSILNGVTSPKIAEYEASVELQALEAVSCGYTVGDKKTVSDDEYVTYSCTLKDNGKTVGYILGLNTNGYGGTIVLTASFDIEGKILDCQIVSDSETPGVGKKAENEGYMDKFIGTGSNIEVPTSKDMLSEEDSNAVSGASITFGGISRALAAGSQFIKDNGGNL